MSDPVKSADKPAEAAKGGGSEKLGPIAIVVIVLVVVFSEVLPMLTSQIGHMFQMLKQNAGPVLFILAAIALFRAFKK